MIIATLTKDGSTPLPYQVKREQVEHPEGKFVVWMYQKKVVRSYKVHYKYFPIRYNQEPARFKTRKEAREFALYRLGL